MSRSERKAANGKPITQHQLFPALVALWFGALFGLGSLALRSSLIEALVVRSRIDLLIPAAAPPLGMTARLLIALLMAALGAMVGSWIAQHLARPGRKARERGPGSMSTRTEVMDGGVGVPDAEPAAPAPGLLANRRRSLAIEPGEDTFVPHEAVPLPGSAPQFLAVAAAEPEPGQPGLESLGIEDLSARLVESLRQRRAARVELAVAPGPEPRAEAETAPEAVPAFEVPPFAVPPFAVQAEPETAESLADPEAPDEADIAEENYASLLGVTPSPAVLRNPFMRPVEPEAETTLPEPVVIFPGQIPPAASEESPAGEAAETLPQEETEHALRSALASLKRISGAA